MSEEEIIKHVEYSLINPCFNNGNSTIINNDDLKGLLDLYNKEQEKNKELENKLNQMYNKQLICDIDEINRSHISFN